MLCNGREQQLGVKLGYLNISHDHYTSEERYPKADQQLQNINKSATCTFHPYVIHTINNVLIIIKVQLKVKHREAKYTSAHFDTKFAYIYFYKYNYFPVTRCTRSFSCLYTSIHLYDIL